MPVENTYGVFYEHSTLNGQHFADTKEKRYDDVVMVEIFIRGDSRASISKRVFDSNGEPITVNLQGDTYPDLYPKAWAHFKREKGVELDGTPLRNMGGIGPGQIMNLNATGIETVEELAELPDSVVLGESGMVDLRKRAQAYLASMNPEEGEKEKAEMNERMESMRKEVEQMKEALEKATIKEPRKRGRPKTEVA